MFELERIQFDFETKFWSFDRFCEHSALGFGTCSFDVMFSLWFVGRKGFCTQLKLTVSELYN